MLTTVKKKGGVRGFSKSGGANAPLALYMWLVKPHGVHVHVYMHVHVHTCACACTYMCVCMCVYMTYCVFVMNREANGQSNTNIV